MKLIFKVENGEKSREEWKKKFPFCKETETKKKKERGILCNT